MSSICLCMIVKNEVDQLPELIASVRPWISSWLICDTGSTDGTQALIRRELGDLPGALHEHTWVDFGTNRSQAVALAEQAGADYLLILDADTTLEVADGAFADLTADAYMIGHRDNATTYMTKRLVRSGLNWRYVGAVHEYIESAAEQTCEKREGIVAVSRSVGALRSGRFERDKVLLEASVSRDPSNARDVFYLAQTYRDLGDTAAAIRWYEHRAGMGGWDEEVFYAAFQAAEIRADVGDWPRGLAGLIAAWQLRPSRLEPLYAIASRLRLRGEHHAAFAFAARGIDRQVPADVLFVSPWVWRYGMLVEYSISAFGAGELKRATTACERLLAMKDLPPAYRESTQGNLELCRQAARGGAGGGPARPAASSSGSPRSGHAKARRRTR